jgi:hypothetical protein
LGGHVGEGYDPKLKPKSGKSRNWLKTKMDLGEKVGPVSRREGFAHIFLFSK